MSDKRIVVTASLDTSTFEMLNALVSKKTYSTRSEAIRDALHKLFLERYEELNSHHDVLHLVLCYISDWTQANKVIGTLKHQHKDLVLESFHYDKDAQNCLEILLLSGDSLPIENFVSKLRGTRAICHVQHIRIPLIFDKETHT